MPSTWDPGSFLRFERSLATSTNVAKVVTTNGKAYIKVINNPEGPHALAREWVGTGLARLIGLSTLDYATLEIDAAVDEIPLYSGRMAASGPAFCTKDEPGHPWGGAGDELKDIENPEDIVRLVVFDTWIRNRDRHFPDESVRRPNLDNVFLSEVATQPGKYRLLAIDHTHCFSHGAELTTNVAQTGNVKDPLIYGLFPQFERYFGRDPLEASLRDLGSIAEDQILGLVNTVPAAWDVGRQIQDALADLLVRRAAFLLENIDNALSKHPITWANL